MQIKVKFIDGRIELVRPKQLQQMINARRIIQFRRTCGWVDLDNNNIRSTLRGGYRGPERRASSDD